MTDANAVVSAFAANPAFRAAERHELATPENAFRRPVRPDDLDWLDYSRPLPTGGVLKLSALLGHRMLRNIYDGELLLVPATASETVAQDRGSFHDPRNRLLGALARPVLENHLFATAHEVRAPGSTSLEEFARHAGSYQEECAAEPGRAFTTAAATRGRKQAATFMLLQYSAWAPASAFALARAAIGAADGPGGEIAEALTQLRHSWSGSGRGLAATMEKAGLSPVTAAYWQLYLGTTLARGNLLRYLEGDKSRPYAVLGAAIVVSIDQVCNAPRYAAAISDGLGFESDFFATVAQEDGNKSYAQALALIEAHAQRFGPSVIGEVWDGFEQARWLREVWDEDLSTQLAWADRIEEHQARAQRIDTYLKTNQIEVDLDTFVESCEETSTTHVHDDHRLVMIESGQMHFWNNITHRIGLNEGDMVLIPAGRLHGSTVLSGECTYHQPIISDEILLRVP